ncbi:MAG: LuxR C-terminal-related transcriptional regulator, partial [Desulfobacterales bacterium]
LRARSQLTEIRLQDLRFTAAETAVYLQQILKMQIDEDLAAAWSEKTEGWVTGLRLAALTLKHQGDFKTIPPELQGGTQYVMEYLFNEILSHQSSGIRDFLLQTSILDRFCVPLYDAMFGTGAAPGVTQNDAWQFINQLKKDNLFVISLDAEGHWFRYHHLFQALLKRQLQRIYSAGDINTLHSKASEWFESQGLIMESIKHALAAEDHVRAAEIVERYRNDEFNADRWYNVERWLTMLPAGIKKKRPNLLLSEAWIRNLQHQLAQVPMLLDQAQLALGSETEELTVSAEIAFFRGYISYFEGQAEQSLQYLEDAVTQLSGTNSPFLGESELMRGLARCMVGQKESAVRTLEIRIGEAHSSENYLRSRLIAGLAFIYLVCGNLNLARVEAQRLQRVSQKHNMRLAEAWSYYFLGCIHLQTGEFEAASLHFTKVAELCYVLEPRASVDALTGLVLAQQLMGLDDEAAESYHRLQEFARELDESNYMSVARSCQARLLVLRGDVNSAVEWGRLVTESPVPAELFSWLEAPAITQARVLIAAGSEQSLVNATKLLQSIRDLCEACRFKCQLIEIAILQSLVLERQGRTEKALDALKEAVALAKLGGWIRPFVEAGPTMVDLLMRLRQQNVSVDYIERILAAFPDTASSTLLPDLGATNDKREFEAETVAQIPDSKIQNSLIEPLTNRELDVLELLAQRLQNKEIAEKLFVSPATVKSHLERIYQKLNVSKRREAVDKANALKIITRR